MMHVLAVAALSIPVLFYHMVSAVTPSDPIGRQLTLSPAAFSAQLVYLQRIGARTMTARAVVDNVRAGRALPPRAVVLTFDDGYRDDYTEAFPLLRKYGDVATFFIITGTVGTPRHVTWGELRTMKAAGMEIACHGVEHLDLSTMTADEQRHEVAGCIRSLQRHLGGSVTDYAYPSGQYNSQTLKLMAAYGIRAAFTTKPPSVTRAAILETPYELPRWRVERDTASSLFSSLWPPPAGVSRR